MNHNEKTPAVNLPRQTQRLIEDLVMLAGASKISENTAEILNYLSTSKTFNDEDFELKQELNYHLVLLNRLAVSLMRYSNVELGPYA